MGCTFAGYHARPAGKGLHGQQVLRQRQGRGVEVFLHVSQGGELRAGIADPQRVDYRCREGMERSVSAHDKTVSSLGSVHAAQSRR